MLVILSSDFLILAGDTVAAQENYWTLDAPKAFSDRERKDWQLEHAGERRSVTRRTFA